MSNPVILTAAVVIPWGTMAAFIVKDRMRRNKSPKKGVVGEAEQEQPLLENYLEEIWP